MKGYIKQNIIYSRNIKVFQQKRKQLVWSYKLFPLKATGFRKGNEQVIEDTLDSKANIKGYEMQRYQVYNGGILPQVRD